MWICIVPIGFGKLQSPQSALDALAKGLPKKQVFLGASFGRPFDMLSRPPYFLGGVARGKEGVDIPFVIYKPVLMDRDSPARQAHGRQTIILGNHQVAGGNKVD